MSNYNVLLVGESAVGKTSLIKKFVDGSHEITARTPESYWDHQDAPTNVVKSVKVAGKDVKLDINEVAGSKGRMSNYYEMMQQGALGELLLEPFFL